MSLRLAPILSIVLAVACQSDERVHTASISFAELINKRTGQSSLAGFACSEGDAADTTKASSSLLRRALTITDSDVVLRATLVVDAVRLDGYPRCRLTEIANFCDAESQSCAVIAAQRRCFDLEPRVLDNAGNGGRLKALAKLGPTFADYVRTGLSGQMLTDDALDDEVLVRVVGTTQTCAELEASGSLAFLPEQLLGCTYSCPLVLSAARGDIVLDSEALGFCTAQVVACASPAFTPLAIENVLPASF